MKIIISFCLTLIILLGSAGCDESPSFEKSMDAAKSADYVTAVRHWKPLAEGGNYAAQRYLGLAYISGEGVPQDFKTAQKWLRLAAEQGDAESQYYLGVMYENRWGVKPKDTKTQLKWYTLAAEKGYAAAQSKLGEMYVFGDGIVQDYVYAYM